MPIIDTYQARTLTNQKANIMKTFKIDGRRNFNVAELNNGGTVEASKYHGMYSVKVINNNRLVVVELASLVSKEKAEEIVNDYLAAQAIDTTAPVAIYKNLHNGLFSVKQGGLVVAHVASVTLTNVHFKVSEAGRQRVLRDKQKNVHAFVVGMIKDINKPCDKVGDRLSYNPYKADCFTWCDNGNKAILNSGELLYCDSKKGLFLTAN